MLETPAPVDVINISEQKINMPQLDLAQMLAVSAPSFSAFRSQGGDLSSHVDPPTLRGLAPNQMLVLINGKRRHTSALLAGTQTGSSANAVDMSFLPTDAIQRVEILRDGAAAQYGSDAIAGVMNVILKKGTGVFSGSFTSGFNPNNAPDLSGSDLSKADQALLKDTKADGLNHQLSGNYGISLKNGGYLNVTGLYRQSDRSIRPNIIGESTSIYGSAYLNNQRTDTQGNVIITNPELVNALASGNDALANELRTDAGLLSARGLTRRDVSTYAGQPRSSLGSVSFNLGTPISPNAELYAFGDFGYKYTEGFSCFYRRPAQTDRANFDLYPNGFRPQIFSNQTNISLSAGVKGKAGDLNYDFSNTFGSNSLRFDMFNTMNASLQSESPTKINLGRHAFSQNTTNFDLSRYFPNALSGITISAGAEMRFENYSIVAGQAEGYTVGNAGNFTATKDNQLLTGPDGQPLEDRTSTPIVDASGNPISLPYAGVSTATVKQYSPNCQCFRSFAPENETNQFRAVTGTYLDIGADLTKSLFLNTAVRAENYSDFGGVVTGKAALRYSITEHFALRGSISSGFRAPSLQELNYSHTFTFFVGLNPFDGTLYPNTSSAARAIGIKQLKEERSTNVSIGFATKLFKKLDVTVDAYRIDITNRVFETSEFDAVEAPALKPIISSGLASFRINGGDVSTKGIEVDTSYNTLLRRGNLGVTLSGIFRQNTFERANVPNLKTALTKDELQAKYIR